MKGLFGFLFAIMAVGCFYFYTEWQQANMEVQNLNNRLNQLRIEQERERNQAYEEGRSYQAGICEEQIEAAEMSGYNRGYNASTAVHLPKIEAARLMGYQKAERYYSPVVDSLKFRYSLEMAELQQSHQQELSTLRVDYEQLKEKQQTYTAALPDFSKVKAGNGILNTKPGMNVFVLIMMLLSPFMAGAVLRVLKGKRGMGRW